MDLKILITAIVLSTSGFMAVAYEQIANSKYWGVGSLYRMGNGLSMVGLGVLLAFGAVFASIIHNPWWAAIIVFCVAATLARILIEAFKSSTQAVVPLMMIVSLPVLLYYVFQ